MGKHKEWRKVAKKMRRKRIRTKIAKMRDALREKEEEEARKSPGYEARRNELAILEAAQQEAEKLAHDEMERKWLEEEARVREEFDMKQALLKQMEEAKERKRKEEEEARIIREEAEKLKKEKMAEYIYKFARGENCGLPAEMLIPSETQPGKDACPFFSKVAACRFWDTCSRNHIRPALSNTLLFPGFYSHFSLSKIGHAEYDTDMSLEYDDKETYNAFVEFYRDIRYEFEVCGRLTQLVVCSNPEPHLRGNVYISYATEREAMSAYLKFNGRYYAGKQLSCSFVTIPSWKNAICGLHFRKKCPKGNTCNFLHIFKDPGPPFYRPEEERSPNTPDDWRWSVSPEREGRSRQEEHRGRKRNSENRRSRERRRSRSRERKEAKRRKPRERSRSQERKRSRSRGRRKTRSISRDKRKIRSKERKQSRSRDRKHNSKDVHNS